MTPAGKINELTVRQRNVLGQIAVNQDEGHSQVTLQALLRLGLIEEYEEQLPGQPVVVVKHYRVPLGVHMAWCAWCSEHVKREEPPD